MKEVPELVSRRTEMLLGSPRIIRMTGGCKQRGPAGHKWLQNRLQLKLSWARTERPLGVSESFPQCAEGWLRARLGFVTRREQGDWIFIYSEASKSARPQHPWVRGTRVSS